MSCIEPTRCSAPRRRTKTSARAGLRALVVGALLGIPGSVGPSRAVTPPAPADSSLGAPAGAPPPTCRAVPIGNFAAWRALTTSLGPERLLLVLKLNRVDLAHVRARDTLVVPEFAQRPVSPGAELMALSPFPRQVPHLSGVRKFIVVSRRIQAFAAYERGALVRWGPVSTGRRDAPTPTGLFHTNWKAKRTVSTENPEWILNWYFNLKNATGVSLHQYELPGYPASHSCVRLLEDDARWIYSWAEQWVRSRQTDAFLAEGTPVLILGDYAYGRRPPWKRLPADPHACDVPPREIGAALAGRLNLVLERQRARELATAK